jgi:hypothetical protein
VERAQHFRRKATDCVAAAANAIDPAARNEWLMMANAWTALAEHVPQERI